MGEGENGTSLVAHLPLSLSPLLPLWITLPKDLSMDLNLATDYLVFDATQTLTYLAAGGGEPVEIAGCSGARLTRRQLELVGPLGLETVIHNFSLPVANFSGTPRGGDQLTDAGGTRWQIAAAQLVTLGSRWLCVCRRMQS